MEFFRYLLVCLALAGGPSALAVSLWSDMGCGVACLDFVRNRVEYAYGSAGAAALVLACLYVLDFFVPPHLPGQYFLLREGHDVLGRLAAWALGVAALTACCFSASAVPALPLFATTFLCPALVICAHEVLIDKRSHSIEDVTSLGFEQRMGLLREVLDEERQLGAFYAAAMSALAVVGIVCLCIWVPWAVQNTGGLRGMSQEERELGFVMWVAPLVVGVSDLVFAGFVSLRVALSTRYKAAYALRNRLIVAGVGHGDKEELMRHRETILRARLSRVVRDKGRDTEVALTMSAEKVEQYLKQHVSCMWLLSAILKSIGCAFTIMLGTLFVTLQLVTAIGRTASSAIILLAMAYFVTFISFAMVCFSRLWQAMSGWLVDLTLWRSAQGLLRASWARAGLMLLFLPLLPFCLAFSAINQWVRRARGLDARQPALQPGEDSDDNMLQEIQVTVRPIFTRRVQELLRDARAWDWVAVVHWWYVLAWVMVLLRLTPVLLNVLLAWLRSVLANLDFGVILTTTFALGMFLFMLPPVPGPPIYLFGGVVISGSCPLGFWWGCGICVGLSFVLKLTACAVQQKLVGELLGSSPRVRRAVGVHKPLIRAVELVLRRPGISMDKCMILCGGPDWPVSVLAGILGVSVWQCLLGTLPVIASVVPLCLTGSFYLKRSEGEVWNRAGNLMLVCTMLVSVGFWAGMGWAVQDVLERCHAELSNTNEELLQLEWLDYRTQVVAERRRLGWVSVPFCVRVPFLWGALGLTVATHILLWYPGLAFNSFEVTDDVRQLTWSGLVTPVGSALVVVVLASSLGFLLHSCWDSHRCSLPPELLKELDGMEAVWKEERREESRQPRQPSLLVPEATLRRGETWPAYTGEPMHSVQIVGRVTTDPGIKE